MSGTAIVVGGGLLGVASAWALQAEGFATTLLEARGGVGLGTSFANGATLTPSMSEPWNAPGVHRQLWRSLSDPYAAMKLRLTAVPGMTGWGLSFLRNAAPDRYAAATRTSYVLADYSLRATCDIAESLGLSFDASPCGSLKVFRNPASLQEVATRAQDLAALGLRYEVLDAAGAVAVEPALAAVADKLTGAIRYPDDLVGDAHLFCCGLAAAFNAMGGQVRTGAPVRKLTDQGGRVTGVALPSGLLEADLVVVAAGHESLRLLRPLGVKPAIHPVKGYTLTFPGAAGAAGPRMPVVDDALHALVTPLGQRLRVAGTAEFCGPDLRIRAERVENLFRLVQDIYPQLAGGLDPRDAVAWAGLRPMSADGLPYVGQAGVDGLYINAGHGHLGWTCAVGSARLLADLTQGRPGEIDAAPYDPRRGR